MERIIEEGAVDQSLAADLASTGVDIDAELPDRHGAFRHALDDLVAQGQRAGTVRSDIDRGAQLDGPLRIVREKRTRSRGLS